MTTTQLESAIEKKAKERAEARAEQFKRTIQGAWKEFFGKSFEFTTADQYEAGKAERAELIKTFVLICGTDGHSYVRSNPLYQAVLEEEKVKLVDEILKTTEAVRELAGMRGEES